MLSSGYIRDVPIVSWGIYTYTADKSLRTVFPTRLRNSFYLYLLSFLCIFANTSVNLLAGGGFSVLLRLSSQKQPWFIWCFECCVCRGRSVECQKRLIQKTVSDTNVKWFRWIFFFWSEFCYVSLFYRMSVGDDEREIEFPIFSKPEEDRNKRWQKTNSPIRK